MAASGERKQVTSVQVGDASTSSKREYRSTGMPYLREFCGVWLWLCSPRPPPANHHVGISINRIKCECNIAVLLSRSLAGSF